MLQRCVLALGSFAVVGLAFGGLALGEGLAGQDVPGEELAMPMETSTRSLADQLFHVDWSAARSQQGQSRIAGYVYNDYGEDAMDVHLRITEVDETDRAVESTIRPVDETIPASGRAYFDVRVPDSASYQVRVVSFDFLDD
jgi:hypothetical protein